MAKIYCDKQNCKHIGRKCTAYRRQNGEPLYCCKKKVILITDLWDMDKEIQIVSGEIARCAQFEPVKDMFSDFYKDKESE